MDQSLSRGDGHGGEVAAKRPNLSSSGEDRLSALHDDIIVLILLRLDTIAEAARTSVLSSRWRRIWTLLQELTFTSAPDDRHILEVLAVPEAPALHRLLVVSKDRAHLDSVAAWLPIAARRISGAFMYHNSAEGGRVEDDEEDEGEKGTIALPCFGNATKIVLRLRLFSLVLPPSGAFTRLTVLILERVRFQGTCEVGDMVSSPRCPCLKMLRIRDACGVARLTLHSESLLKIDLWCLNGLQRLDIDAPVLNELALIKCFVRNQSLVANISAPQLLQLIWRDAYHPSYVQLGNLGKLQRLGTNHILVYGERYNRFDFNAMRLLQRFQVIPTVVIVLCYPQVIGNFPYLMEDITYVPRVMFLTMYVMNQGHSFGAGSFHVLRLCTGVRRLSLVLHTSPNLEAQSTCPSGCICDQPTNWKTDNLSLNFLRVVEITDLRGSEHEAAFLKQLFNWAVILEKYCSMAESGGEVAAKRPNLFPSGEAHLSALPDDLIVLILLRLDTIAEAARTSVLSSRWCRIWTLLPELTFRKAPDHSHIREVLAATEAPPLRQIRVTTNDDAPDSMAAWLPLAARRLSGVLRYRNSVVGRYEEDEDEDDTTIVPLPCFGKATEIVLNLGFLALALPSSGEFTRLTDLSLKRVRFQGTCELGNIVSSPRCPYLRKLRVHQASGMARLTVLSESLLEMALHRVHGLQQLCIDASALKELTLGSCLLPIQPAVNISAPQLVSLVWADAYDPTQVQLGTLGQLQLLRTYFILAYGENYTHNRSVLRLVQRFKAIHSLNISIGYRQVSTHSFVYIILQSKTQLWTLLISSAQVVYWYQKIVIGAITYQTQLGVTIRKAKELRRRISSISRPETVKKFYKFRNREPKTSCLILLRLETISEAVRTSALSRRWRRIWTLLPELKFWLAPDDRHIREVLAAAPEAPALRRILVFTKDDAPNSVAAWLPLAARRLSGHLLYHNSLGRQGGEEEEEEVYGAIPLPCFGKATTIDLSLGFLALSLPSSGAFARLTELCLSWVWFQGPCELGDIVSSRCPGLRKLSLRNTQIWDNCESWALTFFWCTGNMAIGTIVTFCGSCNGFSSSTPLLLLSSIQRNVGPHLARQSFLSPGPAELLVTSMEQSGGDGELADPSDAGADRLSGLPDDVLVLILLRLDTAANAARTSVLSHRWRRVWTLLPELCFPLLDPHRIASALAAHEAALRILLICTQDAAPDAVAAWLRVAAPRLSGRLTFINWAPGSNGDDDCEGDSEEDGGDRGAFELPCLEGATTVKLELGLSLGLAMPSAGVFFRLIDLSLSRLRFYGPCSLGDAISSPRCPCLQKLSVRDVRGLFNLSVHSGSLLQLDLWSLVGLQELVIDAPALKGLKLVNFLVGNQPVVKISAPELISLFWAHAYYPSSMQLSRMAQLQHLPMNVFFVHGDSFHRAHNRNCLRFLQQFQVIHSLTISLGCYGQVSSHPL
ncbi:hypothetical protein PR202_gb12037 [Eleusine coracana subsp. coracana]|uniref:F-box domain-containing protein n=1 Tax=Eleusine coracana subsp. coracana TaxID=191504 RepID=A0AAV5ENI1_ELECO|nr:hypothetical protein PR202_gb12037 [Eleusine coracana subsp. coracana]